MFNTQANWGSVIAGISIALEEKAAQEPEEQREATTQLVTGLKTGLMGPVSGIGDTLDFGTLRPIVIGVCIPFVIQGYVIAALLPDLPKLFTCFSPVDLHSISAIKRERINSKSCILVAFIESLKAQECSGC